MISSAPTLRALVLLAPTCTRREAGALRTALPADLFAAALSELLASHRDKLVKIDAAVPI